MRHKILQLVYEEKILDQARITLPPYKRSRKKRSHRERKLREEAKRQYQKDSLRLSSVTN